MRNSLLPVLLKRSCVVNLLFRWAAFRIQIKIFLVAIILLLFVSSCQNNAEDISTSTNNSSATATKSETPIDPSAQETSAAGDSDSSPTAALERMTAAAATPNPIVGQTSVSAPTPEPPTQTPTPTPTLLQSISLVPFAGEFERPTDLVHANDEQLFVVEQGGAVWIVRNGERIPEPFLDITDRVKSSELEQGLLSIAFHPRYPEVNSFFAYYTNLRGDVVISRFKIDNEGEGRALAESEEILLIIEQPFNNHNGGQLKFGPDNLLYIGVGDGGSAGDPFNNGQNPTTLLGTLLRIGVDVESGYMIPDDNPFVNEPSIPDEIWSFGLRNPWRLSFDRETGALYLSDVGQSTWEEINFQQPGSSGGANYGWNVAEGNHCFGAESCDTSRFVQPAAEYSHIEGGCSVTGGYVYRGRLFPEMRGNYIFGDYCSGFIWSLIQEASGEWKKNLILEGGFNISSFGEGVNGELYVLDHTSGTIYHLQP